MKWQVMTMSIAAALIVALASPAQAANLLDYKTLEQVPAAVQGVWCWHADDEQKGDSSYKKAKDCKADGPGDTWIRIGPKTWEGSRARCKVTSIIFLTAFDVLRLALECRGEDQEFHKYY